MTTTKSSGGPKFRERRNATARPGIWDEMRHTTIGFASNGHGGNAPHRRRLYWPWLNERDIADASQDAPQLKESIVEEFHAKDAESAEPETIVRRLEDAPSITRQWELYIDNIWLPWASEERRLQPVVSRCTRAPKTAETPVSVSVIDKQDEQLGPCGDSCHSRVLAMFSPNLRGSGCSAKLNSASTIPALARLIASQPAPS
jgi:hypothetical protein